MIQLSDKQIRLSKIAFNLVFVSIVIFQMVARALELLPNNWLFFLTSDSVEYFIFSVIGYLLYYRILIQKNLWHKISFILICIIVIVALVSLKSYRMYHSPIFHSVPNFEKINKEFFNFHIFSEFLGKTFILYCLIYILDNFNFFSSYKQLEIELNNTKEQLLKNQLHPHFLFNAFNSLYGLALKNSDKTPDTILKLSGMMRYLTDNSMHTKVKLSREIKFIEEYIAIEKIRFGEDAGITLFKEGNLEDYIIAPLLLITLVENAFKHGFYTNDSNAFVNIHIQVSNDTLLFKVKNSIQNKQHFNEKEREGKGLENLKRRLQISYPKASKLLLESKDNLYLAQLKLDLK